MSAHDDPPKSSDDPFVPGCDGPTKAQARKGGGAVTREDRLKAALKANMGRRKAQARARAASDNNEKE